MRAAWELRVVDGDSYLKPSIVIPRRRLQRKGNCQ
jgi:hypothetical protein